jgi:hypothetical protein
MSRMIDLIRQSSVPASLMRSASLGALSLPPAETLEILVFLAQHAVFGRQAQLTLAGWDEEAASAVVSDPQTPAAVLDYFAAPANLRPGLLPLLLENAAVSEARLVELAQMVAPSMLAQMTASARVCSCPQVVRALLLRAELDEGQRARLETELERMGAFETEAPGQDLLEPELSRYLAAHAAEITAEENHAFHLVDSTAEEQAEIDTGAAGRPPVGLSLTAAAARALGQAPAAEGERMTPIQRIAHLSVGERVQLAYRGTRDERFILIRDGARVVSSAVLESPKITESEVETFTAMRNVGEHVLRIIGTKRKWIRRYAVKRILTANPRCPLETAVPFIKELLLADLKYLMTNKNVSDMVRHLAYKVWKDKSGARQ